VTTICWSNTPRATDEEWTFRLRAHDREPLAAFQAACTDHGITLRVQEVHHNPDDPDHPAYGLTEKQQEALTIAHANGYFEIPQAYSLTELAEECDSTRQAFSRRLNRGLSTLLTATALAGTPPD
jgi:predicted DNA binding protein